MDKLKSLLESEQKSTLAQRSENEPPSHLVGIAASVKELETLELFFDEMPIDSGMAFVILAQSSDSATHLMCEMIWRHTEMPIYRVVEETIVARNSIYLIPPHNEMIITGGSLRFSASDSGEESAPPRHSFFHSLALEARERAIALVLSEIPREGSEGMQAIGEAGGLVIVVDSTLNPDTKPNAAVDAGSVSLRVAPTQIAKTILNQINHRSRRGVADHPHNDLPIPKRIARQSIKRNQIRRGDSAANAQLAEVLNAATQFSICATDVDGMITLFNSGAEKMLGYKSSEMVGKQTPRIMHLDIEIEERGRELSRELGRQVDGFEVFIAYAKEGRFERRDWTYVRKDGRHLTVSLVVTAVRNSTGEITGFLGVAEDISERKKSEEALRKSEERFDLAVSGSNDGLWDWDLRSDEVYYSPRFKELLDYADHEFENTFASFENRLHPDDRPRTLEAVRSHLENRTAYDVEYQLRKKCGQYGWFRARGQAVWDDAGQAVRMAGSLTDITEQKRAEAALERFAAEIQNANETLRAAESEARRAVIERDQFLAMLSHELRNPLSAILHGVGVLDHADADQDAVARARQAIRGQAHHMSRLLDDLLDVARITQGKIEFRKQVLDLNELIREAVGALQPKIDLRRQHLSVNLPQRPVMVDGDPTRLLQIIENLLTNASKYTPPEGAITLELKTEGDQCALSVRDDGRGMDPDTLDEIFDMFFQSNRALDRSDGGMGVGLTLVRTLVSMHAGSVSAHSKGLGLGSEFVVRLPLTSKLPAKSSEPVPTTAAGEVRVLLVEDNPDSREMLQSILTLDGFQVEVAEDGQQGLDAILAQRPDVALIDIGLPMLDGYEVARRVRKQLRDSEVRLVALTGYGQAKDREAVFDAGFDEHLVKPVDPAELSRILSIPRKPR